MTETTIVETGHGNGEMSLPDAVSRVQDRGPRIIVAAPRRPGKRLVEPVVALVLALATLPVQLLCLALSAASFRAFPIFRQQRVGRGGTPFWFAKIRSLPASAPDSAPKEELAAVQNTRVGKFLRRTHLDELVQLWSVVTGKMSLVGPRPEMIGLSAQYEDDFVQARTIVLPGITGLWQIGAGSGGLIFESPEFDVFYVEKATLRLDLWIAWRTLAKMASGRMVEIDDVPQWAIRA